MALSFFGLALKTLISKKPMIFASRWMFAFVLLAFLPSMFNPFLFKHPSLLSVVNPLMFAVVLVFMWIQMKGYMVFGVSDAYVREALLDSIKTIGFTPVETMSRLQIKETGEEFQVAIQGWVGTAVFKPVGKSTTKTTRDIALAMNNYFRTTPGKMNYIAPCLYLILGIFMAVTCIGIVMLPHAVRH